MMQMENFSRSNLQSYSRHTFKCVRSWKFLKESVKNCTLVLKILKGTQLSSIEALYTRWRERYDGRKYLNSIENVSCFLGKIGILFDYS